MRRGSKYPLFLLGLGERQRGLLCWKALMLPLARWSSSGSCLKLYGLATPFHGLSRKARKKTQGSALVGSKSSWKFMFRAGFCFMFRCEM